MISRLCTPRMGRIPAYEGREVLAYRTAHSAERDEQTDGRPR
jgi:hypothetical protein